MANERDGKCDSSSKIIKRDFVKEYESLSREVIE